MEENTQPTAETLQKLITPVPAPPPHASITMIAGFWRRLGAYVIDWAILGGSGYLVGLLMFVQFARLGLWGRPVGFAIALLYYGILDSSLGHGQTLGKRFLKIKLVDERGGFFPFPWTMIRYAILAIPGFFSGLILPSTWSAPWVGFVTGLIVLGLNFANIYLLIFNRRTRQGLHDLAVGSFVVRAETEGAPVVRPVWSLHMAVVVLWFAGVLGWLALKTPPEANRDLLAARQAIEQLDHVRAAMTIPYEVFGSKMLIALAVYDAPPEDFSQAAGEIAETLVDNCPQRAQAQDTLITQIRYGYDLGICWSWKNAQKIYNKTQDPKGWNKLMKGTDSK